MELNRQTIKKMFLLICGAIAFFLALQNLKVVFGGIHTLVGMLSPFLLGGAIAFVLNVPMRAIERKLFAKSRKQNKMKRPISLVLALLMVVGILTLAGLVIVPGIKGAMTSLADQIPEAFAKLQEQVMELETYLPQMEQFLAELSVDWGSMTQKAVSMLRNWGSNLISSGSGLVGRGHQWRYHIRDCTDLLVLSAGAKGKASATGKTGVICTFARKKGRSGTGDSAADQSYVF